MNIYPLIPVLRNFLLPSWRSLTIIAWSGAGIRNTDSNNGLLTHFYKGINQVNFFCHQGIFFGGGSGSGTFWKIWAAILQKAFLIHNSAWVREPTVPCKRAPGRWAATRCRWCAASGRWQGDAPPGTGSRRPSQGSGPPAPRPVLRGQKLFFFQQRYRSFFGLTVICSYDYCIIVLGRLTFLWKLTE